tara:strand:- start:546 stop:788 length:243 start_codon:yes stop_codon:yes gene_type:complete
MNFVQSEITENTIKINSPKKTEDHEQREKMEKKERRRPTPIKVDGIFTWDQKKSKYDPPSPPNKNKRFNKNDRYFSFFSS